MKFNWQMVTSGVPQVVILGEILFNIFINNLNDRIESILGKTVDNMTLGGVVNIPGGQDCCLDGQLDRNLKVQQRQM